MIIQHCVSMRKLPRLMQIRRNFLPNLLKDTFAFRVITLIQNTSMRSDDYRTDMDDDHDLVADINPDTLIRIVKFPKVTWYYDWTPFSREYESADCNV